MTSNLYTIGHSNHDLDYFIGLLKDNNVNMLLDVRSVPYSKWTPQFNYGKDFVFKLSEVGILYVPYGDLFGGKGIKPENYDEQIKSQSFLKGVEEIKEVYDTNIIALMCTEYDPKKCHRALMVAKGLEQHEMVVSHILRDGSILSSEEFNK